MLHNKAKLTYLFFAITFSLNLFSQGQVEIESDTWVKDKLELNVNGPDFGEYIWNSTGFDLSFYTNFIERFVIKNDGTLDTKENRIVNLGTPTAAQDAATKSYVDIEISNLPSIPNYAIGDFAHGGIVFWVDETGQHGLVCAKSDQSGTERWYAGTTGRTRATGDGVYAGEANSTIIISSQVAIGDDGNSYAAQVCNDLQITEGGTTYGDWYLPSKYELNLMYQNRVKIDSTATSNGGSEFSGVLYWSSTESDSTLAWIQSFDQPTQFPFSKDYLFGSLRAIRSF